MKKWILILEDNAERRQAMQAWLDDRLHMYGSLITDDPDELIDAVRVHGRDVILVSLDHDLYDRADQSTTLTGMMVVDHLERIDAAFPILLHTSNRIDGERMQSRLIDRGWHVQWVTPFDGTTWIDDDWYPAVKRLLRRKSSRPLEPAIDDRD